MILKHLAALQALAVGALFTFGAVGPASADVINYELTADGCSSPGCGLSDYGTVELTDIAGGGVHVSVSLNAGVNFLSGALYFSLENSPDLTLANLTGPFAQADITGNATPDNFTIGSFGWFDYKITCTAFNAATNPTGCGPGASHSNHGPLAFDITNALVTTASFLDGKGNPAGTGNGTGIFFVADIANLLAEGGTLTGKVGAPADTIVECVPGIDCVNVPEPITLSMFGFGLAGVVAMRRRRSQL
jgi:hypothetical protein